MNVLSKSLHIIDLINDSSQKIELQVDITSYIEELLCYIDENPLVQNYDPISPNTDIVNNIKNIIRLQTDSEKEENIKNALIDEVFQRIANRLRKSELSAQEKISKFGKNIKRGSLIQALVFNDDHTECTYFIAKVNHTEFIEDHEFTLQSGFPKKENVWKSCQFSISFTDDDILVNIAKVFLDNKAKYWTEDFLELKQITTDELNTINAFAHIDSILSHSIKRTAPRDWIIIRNHIISTMRSPNLINYEDMINRIFADYIPIQSTNDDIKHLKLKLIENPEKWTFDKQFTVDPKAITAKIRQVFSIYRGVEININDKLENIKEIIRSYTDESGQRYIRILTDNDKTYDLFDINE